MPGIKYLALLPKNHNEDDRITKVIIRGTLKPNPQQFSINFVNSPHCTDNITYHFKVQVPTQTLIENYKSDGEWSGDHQERYLNIFDGNGSDANQPNESSSSQDAQSTDDSHNNSSTDTAFALEFQFDYVNSSIRVYQVRGQGHNYITEFTTLFSLSEIQSVQVWDDVQKINQFSMGYD